MADQTVAGINVKITADSASFDKTMDKSAASVGKFTRASDRAFAGMTKRIESFQQRIQGTKATEKFRELEQAVSRMGGVSKLTAPELGRLRIEVDRLAAAGGRVPKGLAPAIAQTNKLKGAVGGIANMELTRVSAGLGSVGTSMAALGPAGLAGAAGVAAVGGAIGGIVGILQKGLEASDVQEKAVRGLNLALSNQGRFTAQASIGLQDYAAALQKVTTYGDEEIIAAEAILAQFDMTEDQIRRAIPVVLDFAAATGRNLKDASTAVGKAFAGQTDIMREMGIEIDKSKSKSEQFDEAIMKLERRFGGSAVQEAQTFSGGLVQIGKAASDTMEKLGDLEKFVAGKFGTTFKGVIIETLEAVGDEFDRLAVSITGAQVLFFTFVENMPKFAGLKSSAAKAKEEAKQELADFLSGKNRLAGGQEEATAGPAFRVAIPGLAPHLPGLGHAVLPGLGTPVAPGSTIGGGAKLDRLLSTGMGGGALYSMMTPGLGPPQPSAKTLIGWEADRLATDLSSLSDEMIGVKQASAEIGAALDDIPPIFEETTKLTYDWAQGLQNVANMVGSGGKIGQGLGGLLGGVAGIGATLQGFESKGVSGFKGLTSALKGGSGLGGIVAGLSGVGGIAGAAVGIGKSIVGLFRSDPVEKAQKEIGRALGESVSKEFAEEVMAYSKEMGLSLTEAAKELKKQAERAKRQAGIDELYSAQERRQAGASRIAEAVKVWGASAQVTEAAGRIWSHNFWAAVGEMGIGPAYDAFKSTFERMGDVIPESVKSTFTKLGEEGSPLRAAADASKGLADSLAGVASGVFITQGIFSDYGIAAVEQFAAAGGDMAKGWQANKDQLLALAPLLGNLNRISEESKVPLDATTQGLIDMAKAAGISFPLDPLLRMVEVLEAVAVKLGAIPAAATSAGAALTNMGNRVTAGGFPEVPGPYQYGAGASFPGYSAAKGLRPVSLTRDTVIQAHAGEKALVIPKRYAYAHAARGLYDLADPMDWTKGGTPGIPTPTLPPPGDVVTTGGGMGSSAQVAEAAAEAVADVFMAKITEVIKNEAGPQLTVHEGAKNITLHDNPMASRQSKEEMAEVNADLLMKSLEKDHKGRLTKLRRLVGTV